MASSPMTSWQIEGEKVKAVTFCFLGPQKSLKMVTAAMKLKDAPWKKSYDQARQHIKKQRHYFTNKSPYRQSHVFSCSHVWM